MIKNVLLAFYFLLFTFLFAGCSDLKEMREVKNAPMPPKYVEAKEKETPAEGSLWADRASLYEDQRARRVNDIVTILVSENTNASKKATTNTSRTSTVNDNISSLLGIPSNQVLTKSLAAGIAASGASAFAGEGDTQTATIFTDTISAKVKEVLPNHNLVIESRKETIINNDKQIIVLRGIIRPEDISSINTVSSAQVADAQIYLVGKGVIDDKQSQGWMVRLLDQVWPF
jgi:flagellar L-ring protein precursor FlgH